MKRKFERFFEKFMIKYLLKHNVIIYHDNYVIRMFSRNYYDETVKELLKSEFDDRKDIGFTGFKDINNKKIYVGDTVKEWCNGLISTVVWDKDKGTYKLKGLGNYYIEDAKFEWEIIEHKPRILENSSYDLVKKISNK